MKNVPIAFWPKKYNFIISWKQLKSGIVFDSYNFLARVSHNFNGNFQFLLDGIENEMKNHNRFEWGSNWEWTTGISNIFSLA